MDQRPILVAVAEEQLEQVVDQAQEQVMLQQFHQQELFTQVEEEVVTLQAQLTVELPVEEQQQQIQVRVAEEQIPQVRDPETKEDLEQVVLVL